MSLTVCHVSPMSFLDGNLGGGERYPLALATAETKYAHVRFVTFGRRRKRKVINDVEIEVLPAIANLRGDPSNPISIHLPLATFDCDVLHIHQPMSLVGDGCASMARLLGKKVFVTDQGARGFNFLWRSGRISRYVDGLLAVSDYSARLLAPFQIPSWTIGGGVDLRLFAPPAIDNREGVLCVGRIMPHKGQDLLIRAVPANAKLTFVGQVHDSPYLDHLRRLSDGKHVFFRGAVRDEELVREYQSAIVSVLPSTRLDYLGRSEPHPELLGLVLLEATACATPIIATNVGGPAEIIENGRNGFLVPDRRLDVLRDRISFMLENTQVARDMGRRARLLAEERYSWDLVARRSVQLYERQGGYDLESGWRK